MTQAHPLTPDDDDDDETDRNAPMPDDRAHVLERLAVKLPRRPTQPVRPALLESLVVPPRPTSGFAPARTRTRASGTEPRSSLAPLAVLLVDSSRADRTTLVDVVGRSGLDAEFYEVPSFEGAIARLATRRFDCVIVDYRLPAHERAELVRIAHAASPPCPVIVVTHLADPRIAIQAMREGAYDFFRKTDIDVAELRRSLEASRAWAMAQAEQERSREQLRHLGFYDSLTGLPNRHLFFDRVEKAIDNAHRVEGRFALLMLDLDRFKVINDTLGHAAGDELLAAVARRLESIARRSDTFARIGGDEFAALLVGCDSTESALAIGRKIESALRAPFPIAGTVVSVGVSVGAALYPNHGDCRRTLLANADHAMYAAKRTGCTQEVFTPGPESREARRSAERARKLATAVSQRAFALEYEPLVDPRTGLAHGLDARIRLADATLGRVPPRELIVIAERNALLDQLSASVLEVALDQLVAWRLAGRPARPHALSISVPGRLLGQFDLATRVLEAIAARGLEPSCLMLDLAESAIVAHAEIATRTVRKLTDAGVGITIDELGAGFTSFRHLRDLEFAAVKIHTTFTEPKARNARNASIIRSMCELARGANARAVACGVDDAESLAWVQGLGCDLVRGRAAARAMSASDLVRWESQGAGSMARVSPSAATSGPHDATFSSGIRDFRGVVGNHLDRPRD